MCVYNFVLNFEEGSAAGNSGNSGTPQLYCHVMDCYA